MRAARAWAGQIQISASKIPQITMIDGSPKPIA